jgi:hypothetical protein
MYYNIYGISNISVWFEVLMLVTTKNTIFQDMTLCSLVGSTNQYELNINPLDKYTIEPMYKWMHIVILCPTYKFDTKYIIA